ncbi:MAG: M48 family metalloprotease [Gammaproteobacteria bacterium]|jgi:heat shock protein HtpX
MITKTDRQCPECGAGNRTYAKTCRQCGAPLLGNWRDRRRLRNKVLRRTDFMAAARANQRATRRLVLSLLLILGVLGYLIGWSLQLAAGATPVDAATVWFTSRWGLWVAAVLFLVGVIWAWAAFRQGDRIILQLTGARAVSAAEEPRLHNVAQEMAIAAGIVKPKLYVIETDALNAFATGMSPARSAIGVTRGLLDTLDREELQGVIGHEMGHIVNWDIRYATAVGIIVGLIALVSDGARRSLYFSGRSRRSGKGGAGAIAVVLVLVVFAALAPVFALLVQMAVSRQREFLADATSVRLTRHPEGLISALQKLAETAAPFQGANRATQHMFIVNPFRNFSERASRLLATHPPLSLRIHRLRNLGED